MSWMRASAVGLCRKTPDTTRSRTRPDTQRLTRGAWKYGARYRRIGPGGHRLLLGRNRLDVQRLDNVGIREGLGGSEEAREASPAHDSFHALALRGARKLPREGSDLHRPVVGDDDREWSRPGLPRRALTHGPREPAQDRGYLRTSQAQGEFLFGCDCCGGKGEGRSR